MVLFSQFINNYIKDLRLDYKEKQDDIKENSEKVLYFNDTNNTFLTLKQIMEKKDIIKKSLTQNEINSISKATKDNYLIFHTSTLSTELNHDMYNFNKEIIEETIINQYKEFNGYFRSITKINSDKELSYKNIRVYEFTKKLNLHGHKIDFLETKRDFIKYIESLILSRNKTNIGRVELVMDIDFFKDIEQYFKNKEIKIRVNNKYIYLSLVKKTYSKDTIYIIKESKKGNGNFIYLRTIEKQDDNDKDHITKYLFKYLLKNFSDEKHITTETLIFSKLKLKQKIYSTNFFNENLNKQDLEKFNNRIFTYFKQMEINKTTPLSYLKENDLNLLKENRNNLFYIIKQFFEEGKFFIAEKEEHLKKELIIIRNIVLNSINRFSIETVYDFFNLVFNEYIENYEKDELNLIYFEFKEISINADLRSINFCIKQNEEELLIEELIKETFRLMKKYFNFNDTNKQINYFNDEIQELITIYEYKSEYEYYKFNHLIEAKYQLLTNDLNFNNEDERLNTVVDLFNMLNEFLEIEKRYTLREIKEAEKESLKEYIIRTFKKEETYNEDIEEMILNNEEFEQEFIEGLLNYYNFLSKEEKELFYSNQDKEIKKHLL